MAKTDEYKWQREMETKEITIEFYEAAMIKQYLREGEYISSNCASDTLHTKRPLIFKRVFKEISDKLRELE